MLLWPHNTQRTNAQRALVHNAHKQASRHDASTPPTPLSHSHCAHRVEQVLRVEFVPRTFVRYNAHKQNKRARR